MTDNEIIKVLEKALTDVDAPIGEHWGSGFISTQKIREILDLINRKNAEIKNKDVEIDILIRKNETLKDEVFELRAELERLQKANDSFCEAGGKLVVAYNKTKSEAYKEFAERLKNQYAKGMSWFKRTESYYVNVGDIDELLTELTENQSTTSQVNM